MNTQLLTNPCATRQGTHGVLASLERRIAALLCAIFCESSRAETRRQLKNLDDRLLRDIGLTREDVDYGDF
ncbi:MAG: DUF1127 domain-containing protein [Pseudomonadota bacterium]